MRILALETRNIAGLADGRIEIPSESLVAVAGPNGSGKSRLLLALIAPWLQDLPIAEDAERESVARVWLRLDQHEHDELVSLAGEVGWSPEDVSETASVAIVRKPRAGISRSSEPHSPALENGLTNPLFLERVPSLDVVYLPAERRLATQSDATVDLRTLSATAAVQSASNVRAAALQNAGRLDESEFEGYVRALCVASYLPAGEPLAADASQDESRRAWTSFKAAVDGLLEPKELLPLTRERPQTLLIRLPDGRTHEVGALSSGERQALVILSRLFRAGRSSTVTIVDEPDLHLHPQLAARLLSSIRLLEPAQVIVATHSPFILDSVAAGAILELRPGEPAKLLRSEEERVAAYRRFGFRSSELTQADLLMVTEGSSDGTLLLAMEPALARAALHAAGGRAPLIQLVRELGRYDLPLLGVVDRDVLADPIPDELRKNVFEWPYADIEGVLLADDAILQAMVDGGLAKPPFQSVAALGTLVMELATEQRDEAIAELAQRLLRGRFPQRYPSPRGDRPVERLRDATVAGGKPLISDADFDAILAEATGLMDEADHPLRYVRGKRIINTFASRCSGSNEGSWLIEVAVRWLGAVPAAFKPVLSAARSRLGLPEL